MKVTFIQTGGTIDKDYPRATQGYAYEITEPVVQRINIGAAIGAINVLERGGYIAMNGQVLRWDRCHRDEKSGQFFPK